MRRNRTTISAIVGAVAITGAIGAPAHAADAIIIYSGGLDAWLVDEKDHGLREALRMVDARLLELPAEINAPEFPAPIFQMALRLLTRPLQLQVGTIDDPAPDVTIPFYGQVTITPPRGRDIARQVNQLIAMTGMEAEPVEGEPNLNRIKFNGVTLYLGTGDGGELVVALNSLSREVALPDAGLPVGVTPNFAVAIHAEALQPFIQPMLVQAGPGAEFLEPMLSQYGITGPVLSSFVAATGYGVDRTYAAWRYTHYATLVENMNAMVREPLRRRDMNMVPADATMAQVGRADIRGLADMVMKNNPMMEQLPLNPLDMLEQEIGIHLQRDVLDHFGSSYGFYMSDSTGGGGLLSTVLFVEVADADALRATFQRIGARANELARREAKGYVRLHNAVHSGISMTVLTFPGLPIPFEAAWTISEGYLIAGATPHAVVAAVSQARNNGPSLLANRGFLEMGGDSWSKAIYVSYMDTARLARSGYALTSLICSGIANAVRSPQGAERDPGLILPSFHELVDGAKASVSLYRWDGDDLVCTMQADRSQLVNTAAGLGLLATSGTGFATVALAGGLIMPAIGQARAKAKQAQSMAQLRHLTIAMHTYAADHADAAPPSIDALREYLGGELPKSQVGPVSDGGGDYWMSTKYSHISTCMFPDREIAFYDRAMYEDGHQVAVAFFDGHVETLEGWTFEAMLEEEPNAGTEFDLP